MKSFLQIFGFAFLGLFLWSCATPGSPIGGPKDEAPPVVLKSIPPNYATNFTDQIIKYYFDEIIDLKDLTNNLVVSPPMSRPEIKSNGKVLSIRLTDSLRPETTYTLNFRKALVDNNEGNVLDDFSVIFSTGHYIDSLSISGQVLDARTLEPVKDVSAALLANPQDFMQKDQRPLFTAKADKDGFFEIKHLPNKCMFLAVIKENNNDLTYDTLQEEAGFLTECVSPVFFEPIIFPDSCSAEDSVRIADSIAQLRSNVSYQLLLFKQDLPQGISASGFASNSCIEISFRNTVRRPSFQILNPDVLVQDSYFEWDKTRKNVRIFLPVSGIRNLNIIARDEGFMDTLKLANTHAEKNIEPLKITFPARVDYFDTLRLDFNFPVKDFIRRDFLLTYNDTLTTNISYKIANDIRRQILFSDTLLKAGKSYSLLIPDSSFTDIYGQINTDTVKVNFNITTEDSYANLTLVLKNKPQSSCILEVLQDNFTVLESYNVSDSDTLNLPHLKPGKYKFRVFIDANNNGYWDAGNYREMRLPEKVFIFPKTLSLDAGWEYEEDWEFGN